jgi:hypothetical protein
MAQSEWRRTTQLVGVAAAILMAEHPMTVRQCFYRLVSAAVVENCIRDYRRVSMILTKARNDGRIEFDWIVDRSRQNYTAATWSNLREFGEAVLASYRRDNWQDQENYIEVWTEKDAIIGSIYAITDQWAVTIRALRGFNSTTGAHSIAEHFRDENAKGKMIEVFYLGDFDPSGAAIEDDVARRVRAYDSGLFKIKRLAIFKADIAKFQLPSLRVKAIDPRAGEFIRRHGTAAIELDALPPTELRARLQKAIMDKVDLKRWERAQMVERAHVETTERIVQAFAAQQDGQR